VERTKSSILGWGAETSPARSQRGRKKYDWYFYRWGGGGGERNSFNGLFYVRNMAATWRFQDGSEVAQGRKTVSDVDYVVQVRGFFL